MTEERAWLEARDADRRFWGDPPLFPCCVESSELKLVSQELEVDCELLLLLKSASGRDHDDDKVSKHREPVLIRRYGCNGCKLAVLTVSSDNLKE